MKHSGVLHQVRRDGSADSQSTFPLRYTGWPCTLPAMSVPQPWPRRRPLALLVIAVFAWLAGVLAVVHALTRADAGLMGWPLGVLWLLMSATWFWQWRRAVRRFESTPRPPRGPEP